MTTTIVKKPVRCSKSFKLFDFRVCDEKPAPNDDGKPETSKFSIQMFGINEQGDTCSITVDDYRPFFYTKVGDNWTDSDARSFSLELQKKLGGYHGRSLYNVELVQHKKLYGFSAGKMCKFVKLTFANMATMNKVKRYWYDEGNRLIKYRFNGCLLELYESNIPPLLRYFHINAISPSGWIQIFTKTAREPTVPCTTCDYEYICSQSSLKPLPEKETSVPYKICSFDIEASSSHGDFPIPIKTYKRLASNMIDVFQKHAPEQSRANMLVTRVVLTAFGFDRFDDVDVVYPKYEQNKAGIEQLIAQLLVTAIKDAEKKRALKTSTNTISAMFQTQEEEEDEICDEEPIDEDPIDEDDEDEDGDEEVVFRKWNRDKPARISTKATIVDVIYNSEYTRDQKLKFMDDAMSAIFPELEGDKVTFIGSTFMKYGDSAPYLNHCLVLGSCDPVDGATIESVNSESDLLLKWAELIQSENPDIIIGYNIFGFDYEFMFRRAQENRCASEFLQLSRRKEEVCATQKVVDFKTGELGELSIEHAKVVLASGEYDLKYFKTAGRLQIDMYTYFRRDFNLSSYKLDDVAGQYIGDDIKHIVKGSGNRTELYSNNLTGLNVNDFIHIEIIGFTSDYLDGGRKFRVVEIERGREHNGKKYNVIFVDGHYDIDTTKSIKWGMAKDDVSPQDIFRLANGSASDRAIVAKYCIQDCNLVHHLANKIDVITGYIEMSRICSVPISFLVFRGQGIKLTSFVAQKCREKNTLMPDLDRNGGNEGYEGAIVLPPKCAMYMDNPVACVDYASLYPSAMISQNYSHDSKVWTKEYDLKGTLIKETGEKDKKTGIFIYDNLPGVEYIDIEFDTFRYERKTPTSKADKVKSGKMVCRWAQIQDAIMPAILQELLKARSDTRKMAKTEKDPFMQNILDKRQLGYKVTANSLYGQCGAKTSTFYEKDVAASTTATGRMMITYAKRMIEEVYGDRKYETEKHGMVLTNAEYVYGDSVANYTPVYVRVPGESPVICSIEELGSLYGNNQWYEERGKEFCELSNVETWTEKGWTRLYRVIRHKLAEHKSMWRIQTPSGFVDATDDHSLLTPTGTEVSPKDVAMEAELMHHQCHDFATLDLIDIVDNRMENVSHTYAAAAYLYLTTELYYDVHISAGTTPELVNLTIDIDNVPNTGTQIMSLYQLPKYTGFVYDLTTENHHFAAGIGNMIVHNTDSVFFTFNLKDPATGENIRGKKALEVTIEIAQDVAHLCSSFLKSPMELTYEKTLMPFVLLSKKRYVGMLYETDANKGKLKYMGLSLKRRDACDYLKDTYGGILNTLMKENDIQKAIGFLDQSLNDLIAGNVHMDKLTITRALRSDYKNPKQIAHRVLADRIGLRDPGNKPKPGDRVKYVFINTPNSKALLGDRIETVDYILANKVKIDYAYYITNQLMKPLQQLFGLAVEQIWEYQRKPSAIKTYKKDLEIMEREFGSDYELFMKKKEKYCSAKVKALLFDKVLNKITNDKNKLQMITSFFT